LSAQDLIIAGITVSLSLAVLPYLPSFLIFNVTEKIGIKRIAARIGFFSAGVIFSFILSVWAVSAVPTFFIANSAKMDIIWGLIVLYLGIIVLRKKSAFVIKAARDMYLYWCYGTFLMGTVFGAIWVNYMSMRNYYVNTMFQDAMFNLNIHATLTDAIYFATGLATVIAFTGIITYITAQPLNEFLAKHRAQVKLVCGSIITLFAVYIIFSDVWMILTSSRLPF